MKRWTHEEIEWLSENYPKYGKNYCMDQLKRSEASVRKKASHLQLKVEDAGLNQRKNNFQKYLKYLENSEYRCLDSFENYSGNQTKLKHIHLKCGTEWFVSPNNLPRLVGCPGCSRSGFKQTKTCYLYVIKFEILDLYKIGITSNWARRKYDFGYKPTLICLVEFPSGADARQEETRILSILQDRLINTEELKNGNTETFLWDSCEDYLLSTLEIKQSLSTKKMTPAEFVGRQRT
jgi:hypothetical protein